jgi:hypothetical protein
MSFFSRVFGKAGKPTAAAAPADPIDAFWHWWSRASIELADAFDSGTGLSEALIDAISERVNAIHDGLAWETGPGKKSRHHFALSAEGDAELRVVTQRWLSRAPAPSARWEYYAARQASGSDARRSVAIAGRDFAYGDFRIGIRADAAHAVLDVVVFHPLFAEMSESDRLLPTFLFLDNILGEDDVTSWIGSVDTTAEEPPGADSGKALADAVRALQSDWKDDTVTLLSGERGGLQLVAMVRLGLKRLDYLLHDHHLELTLTISAANDAGFHDAEEGEELNDFEDGLIAELGHRAVWVGHETYGGKRIIHFHADANPALQDEIQKFCEIRGHWENKLSVKHDPSWKILKRY